MVSLLAASLTALAFAVSFFFRSYQDTHHFPVLALATAALLVSSFRKPITLPASASTAFVLLFWLLYTSGFAFSTVPFRSLIAFSVFSSFPITFFALSGTDQDKKLLPFFLPLLAGLALWGLAQSLVMHNGFEGLRATGPFLDPNIYAVLLDSGIIVALGLALAQESGRNRSLSLFLVLLLFAGLIASASRSGLLAMLIAGTTLLAAGKADWRRRDLAVTALAALAIAIFLPFLSGNHLWRSVGTLAPAGGTETASLTDRLALWHTAIEMAMVHPLTGFGAGTFSLYYPAFRQPFADQSLGHFAHCDPLQMAVELGLTGPVLFYGLLLAIFLRTRRALETCPQDVPARLRILTPFAALLAVALMAHVQYPLYMPPVLILCGALLACWHSATTTRLPDGLIALDRAGQTARGLFRGGLAFAGLCLCGVSASAALGNYYMLKSEAERDPGKAFLAMGHANTLSPPGFIWPDVDMARIDLDLIEKTKSIRSPKMRDELLDETTRLLNHAAASDPAWAEIDYLRGRLDRLRGNKALMLEDWFTALHKNKMQFEARIALAGALLEEKRNAQAVNIAAEGLKFPHPLLYRRWAEDFLKNHLDPAQSGGTLKP